MAPKFPPFSFVDKQGRRIEVREAEERDAAAILAYLVQVDRESENLSREPGEAAISEASERAFLRQCADRQLGVFLTAWHATQLVACMDLLPPTRFRMGHAGEFGMTVRQPFWGSGIGKVVLAAMLAWAGKAGLRQAKLRVVADNAPAIALYRGLGFQPCGLLPEDLRLKGHRYKDILWMARRLGPGSPPLPLAPEAAEALGMPGGAWPEARLPRLAEGETAPAKAPSAAAPLSFDLGSQAGPPGPRSPEEAKILAAALAEAGPQASVLLYGSRARGEAKASSDWDLVAFAPLPPGAKPHHLAKDLDGAQLDLFVEDAQVLHGPAREEDLRLLGGRWLAPPKGHEGEGYLARLKALELAGPEPWGAEAIELHRRWAGKMLARMAATEGEPSEAWLRRAEWLAEALGLYERLRRRWPVGPRKGLARLKALEPEAFAVFQAALAPTAGLAEQRALAELILAPVGGPLGGP